MNGTEIISMIETEWRDRMTSAIKAERESCAKIAEALLSEDKEQEIPYVLRNTENSVWKSLTTEEIIEVLKSQPHYEGIINPWWFVNAAIAVDKKLKEKNSKT